MTNHNDCSHPATKAARAICRRDRRSAEIAGAAVEAASVASCLEALGTWNRWYLIEKTTGYPARETEITDLARAHSDLLGQGYTCTRIVWDADDHDVARYFQHMTNDTMSARLELR